MDNSYAVWHLGLGLVIVTAAFGFALKAASRYDHAGLWLLCASLGIEALANLLSLLLIALDSGKSSFLLWSSGVLRYVGLGLLLGGWVLLAISSKSIVARENSGARPVPPMISGAGFLRWGILAVLVISVLAAAWALLMMFAAGMKTVPHLTGEEALSAALPSLALLPISIGLSVLGVRWAAGRIFIVLGIVSSLINLASALLTAISYWSP
jgi:hypothetical protein